ncbi:uncharacterized protein B0I36DRAFT_359595 [Microdochium trichocladiopsis]|uniref:WW domain-containing protein n=1 Tax=Microdochium trichocladiopsis TaxID=1682393 RepID=A0A9P9BUC5_9PEZI|nr:uncharacterized protein B0I36DRAFT_359595 [Microdochium trichocladiopsis]KAH7037977.1 hypothetical protein B0I36DRAFT_359595 [Microdochium trichocladiopsis]
MSGPQKPHAEEAASVAPAVAVTVDSDSAGSQEEAGTETTAQKTDAIENDSDTQAPSADKPTSATPPRSRSTSLESGEASPPRAESEAAADSAPPLPDEAPPLPTEAPPPAEDDGWDFHWSDEAQAYYFYNRLTGATTWENPRLAPSSVATAPQSQTQPASSAAPPLPAASADALPAGGYNPAIHGDYDPNAWYAQKPSAPEEPAAVVPSGIYGGDDGEFAASGSFNRFTGAWQAGGDDLQNRHNDENKSRRQLNAYFDVDAVANTHDGRSLKAERSGKKPSKAELKAFKEKRKARKEEKRRAWLRD